MSYDSGRSRFRNLFGGRSRTLNSDDEVEQYRAENQAEIDAFDNEALARARGIRPDFVADALASPGDSGPKQTVEGGTGSKLNEEGNSARRAASSQMKGAENAAASQGSTSALDARSGENDVSSGFTNNVGKGGSVKGKDDSSGSGNKTSTSKTKGGGFLKKKGPLASIIISLVFGGGGMYLGQASLPFTMLDKLNGLFDTTNTSTEMRSSGFLRGMTRNRNTGDGLVKKNIFGKEKFKPSGRMKKKMAKQGITFSDGKMVYKNKSGTTELIEPSGLKAKLDTDADFRAAYTNGTKNWRTSVAAFKDKLFDKLLKKFGLSKNRMGDYDAEDDPDGSKARKELAEEVGEATEGKQTKARDGGEYGEDRNQRQDLEPGDNGEQRQQTGAGKTGDAEEMKSDLTSSKSSGDVSAKLKSALSKTAALTTLGCGFMKAISAINVILAAYQVMQVMATAQAIFEPIDKARTEDANNSPINAIGVSLTAKSTETRTSAKKQDNGTFFSISKSGDTISAGDTEYEEHETDKAKSAVQSEGLSSLFTGDTIDMENESVQSMNPSSAVTKALNDFANSAPNLIGNYFSGSLFGKVANFVANHFSVNLGGALDFARKSYVACIEIEATIALVGAAIDTFTTVTTIVSVVGAFFTAGASLSAAAVSEGLKAAWKAVKELLVSAIKAIAISLAVSIGTQILVNILKRKLVTEFLGEDLGNAIYSGGSALMSRNHRAGGGLVADKEGYLASLIYNDAINVETAKNERLAYSPFDYRSQYTFAGQLASSIIPITLQSESLLDSFGNFMSTVGNSVRGFMPSASAISAAEKVEVAVARTEENCPELSDIGIVGDAFCNPYVTTDFRTIDMSDDDSVEVDDMANDPNSPYNVVQKTAALKGFKDNGNIEEQENPEIDLESDLGRYVTYCGQRESPFGQPDQNIMGEMGFSTGSSAGDAALGVVPVVGDLIDLFTDGEMLEKWGWIDGSNCVMNHSNDSGHLLAKRVSYNDIQVYNRYTEDQRLAEAMGAVDKSAVSIALDEYYEAHPLDNSFEGMLARYSGMTKENVIATIDTMEFYTWLAQYDPTSLYPTPAPEEELPDYTIEDNRYIKSEGILAVVDSGFTEIYRQRNFATA